MYYIIYYCDKFDMGITRIGFLVRLGSCFSPMVFVLETLARSCKSGDSVFQDLLKTWTRPTSFLIP